MIVFDLQCHNGHRFEGWFDDHPTLCRELKEKKIQCPICDDDGVVQVPASFGIVTNTGKEREKPVTVSAKKAFLHFVKDFLDSNFENVGCRFATEALKIHYGAAEPRNIRGTSTREEEKMLEDEGVKYAKVPVPATDNCDD